MASSASSLQPQKDHHGKVRMSRSQSPAGEDNTKNPRDRKKPDSVVLQPQTDIMIAISSADMEQIATGLKNYQFRKQSLKASVRRIWYYRTAPYSSVDYVCEIFSPPRTRTPTHSHPNINRITPENFLPGTLEEDGSVGNHEFNSHHPEWEGYDFAYKIVSVYKLKESIPLNELKNRYGMKAAPRSLVYTPKSLTDEVEWNRQTKLRP